MDKEKLKLKCLKLAVNLVLENNQIINSKLPDDDILFSELLSKRVINIADKLVRYTQNTPF